MNTEQLSMLEVAVELLSQKKTPQLITTLIQEVLELKGFDDPNGVLATQLYIDHRHAGTHQGGEHLPLRQEHQAGHLRLPLHRERDPHVLPQGERQAGGLPGRASEHRPRRRGAAPLRRTGE